MAKRAQIEEERDQLWIRAITRYKTRLSLEDIKKLLEQVIWEDKELKRQRVALGEKS